MNDVTSEQRIAYHILPTAATMTGVCITTISIVRLIETSRHINTLVDNLFAINSVFFLLSCVLSYFSMRPSSRSATLERAADWVFIVGLAMMVVGGFLLAWEIEIH